jgi:hypothetical protein
VADLVARHLLELPADAERLRLSILRTGPLARRAQADGSCRPDTFVIVCRVVRFGRRAGLFAAGVFAVSASTPTYGRLVAQSKLSSDRSTGEPGLAPGF